jgi:hypothetical protein
MRDTRRPITVAICWAELEALDQQLAREMDMARFAAMRFQRRWWSAMLQRLLDAEFKSFPAGNFHFRPGLAVLRRSGGELVT